VTQHLRSGKGCILLLRQGSMWASMALGLSGTRSADNRPSQKISARRSHMAAMQHEPTAVVVAWAPTGCANARFGTPPQAQRKCHDNGVTWEVVARQTPDNMEQQTQKPLVLSPAHAALPLTVWTTMVERRGRELDVVPSRCPACTIEWAAGRMREWGLPPRIPALLQT
jgi:hypothetical protein